uniref:Choline/carnitine acyltransferase domain-containing protein n=1 Tax=Cairina moschata TaxID=8855 RepID=A0A8C3BT33_CAIMO
MGGTEVWGQVGGGHKGGGTRGGPVWGAQLGGNQLGEEPIKGGTNWRGNQCVGASCGGTQMWWDSGGELIRGGTRGGTQLGEEPIKGEPFMCGTKVQGPISGGTGLRGAQMGVGPTGSGGAAGGGRISGGDPRSGPGSRRVHGTLSACAEAPPLRPRPLPHPHLVLPPGPLCLRLARALQRPGTKPQALLSLLGAATAAQRQRADEVAAGQGAERHLRALGLAAVGLGEPLPELFRDPGYARATHFRLCTLQVHSREPCWPLRGPLVPDGYGVGVGHSPPPGAPPGTPPGPLRVTVTAFACCGQTGAALLGGALRGALDTLGGLLRRYGPLPGPP